MSNKKQDIKAVDAAGSSAELGKKRRMKIGVLSLISTIVVIAAVIAVNYFVDYIAERYVLEIDMTSESEYEISDETVQLLETLSEPITITVLCDETDYEDNDDYRRLPKVFQRYAQLSDGMVTVKYINAVTNPTIFNQYDELGDLSTGDIIIESSKRYKSLSPYDLLEYQTSSSDSSERYLTGLRAEQRLTAAILYVTANKVPKAAYTTGHQETVNLETLDSLLTSGNYDVDTISLMQTGEVPSDVDLLIISQPKGDFTAEEIDALEDFMNDGGRMIVTYASDTPKLTNLEEYFEEWGVSYENSVVYDPELCLSGYSPYLLPNLTSVEGLTDNLDTKSYTIIPFARPIDVLWSEDNWRGTQVLMTTSNSSYAKDLSNETTAYEQSDEDETGSFTVGVLSYQTTMHNLDSSNSYILFLNAGFVSDTALGNSSFLNKDYFLATLNFMSEDSETVDIESKDLTSDTLVVPGSAKNVLFYLLIIIIPGVCLVSGIVVWARRRHK
jgi:ABC-type uncharacterized transport system involved in gliding motility auxiliary subunit